LISAKSLTLQFGERALFENVNIMFTEGNCYGLIGANGSGKSTFLKILSGDVESSAGEVSIQSGKRMSVLKQDQFAYDEYTVLMTVVMGHQKLYSIMKEKDAIYANPDFTEKDGLRASELEEDFSKLDGWSLEAEAAKLLSDLGIQADLHETLMGQLEAGQKVRVLLAQALFGNPDILLLDEPTNQLDIETSMWLEEFLLGFKNTAIVVSHDRHFLDKVCTQIADIDYGKIQLYTGNYSFWYESSELALRQRSEKSKKTEDKRRELKEFIARFGANASKAKQATSRKKLLEKLTLEDFKPSSRKHPHVVFNIEKQVGNEVLSTSHLSKSVDGDVLFDNLTFSVRRGEKIVFIGKDERAKTALFRTIMEENKPDSGNFRWGGTVKKSYFPKDNNHFFQDDVNIIQWLTQYSPDSDERFVRGFLGKMLFTGEESLKSVKVLSGGEKVRCLIAKIMLEQSNVLILDEPTNHLDLESITALNNALASFTGTVLFTSQDHQFIQTIADRIIEISPTGFMDRAETTFDDYLFDEQLKTRRAAL